MVRTSVDVDGNPLSCTLYLDGWEKENLDYLNKRVINKWDFLGIVVGGEGNGKTAWALQRALYMSGSFNIANVVFNEKQFLEATENLPRGSAIVWDESDAASGHWASAIVQAIKKRFKRCRKNNYKIFLVTPTFFDFDKYFIIHRANFLIDVYSKGITRGFFRFFGKSRMKSLYFKGKQFWNMKAEYPDFVGRFANYPDNFPINMLDGGEYDLKKDAAMRVIEEESIDPKTAVINYRRSLVPLIVDTLAKKDVTLTQKELGFVLGISLSTIKADLKAIAKKD